MLLRRQPSIETTRAQELRQLVRLALGMALDERNEPSWEDLFAQAERERLVALTWSRSGAVIRRRASREVSSGWRRRAAGVQLRGEVQLALAVDVIGALRKRGLSPVLMKGAPISALLYGDPTLRPTGDIDLYVPLEERDSATATLVSRGWRSVSGESPEEETFELYRDGCIHTLEVHSAAFDDPLLWHVRVPIRATLKRVTNSELPIFSGSHLPSYLAAHLAKHESFPLLWLVDFHSLWRMLSDAERNDAERAARESGLLRHLQWARRLAAQLEMAAEGSDDAARELIWQQQQVGDLRRVVRLLRLSRNPRAAAKTIRGRLIPPGRDVDWRKAPRALIGRAAGWAHRRWLTTIGTPAGTGDTQRPALPVDDDQFATLLGESLGRGLAIWIRARGESMQPAIPPMASVRVLPLNGRTPGEGDVVLARLPHGQYVLHRVVRSADSFVHLKGDSLARRDAVVPTSAVLGICDQVETDGRIWRIADRPRDSVQLLRSELWLRTRAVLASRVR